MNTREEKERAQGIVYGQEKERLRWTEALALFDYHTPDYQVPAAAIQAFVLTRALQFPYKLLLPWEKRRDGYWNADCPCGSALCGVSTEHERIGVEAWHFSEEHSSAEHSGNGVPATDVHRVAFAPDNAAWLKVWFELCAEVYAAQRRSTIAGAAEEQYQMLQKQDAHRKELLKRMQMLGRVERK